MEVFALGVGHSTPVLIEIAEACGYHIAGLYHYNEERTGEIDHGYKILGSFKDLLCGDLEGKSFLLTMGENEIRENIYNELVKKGASIPTIIHPNSIISKYSTISDSGVIIGPFVEIQADVQIGCDTIVRTGVVICHNTSIGKHCFIGPKGMVGAYTEVSDNVYFGQGALSISGKVPTIGKGSLIGARSLVSKEVPDNVIVVGAPAKILKQRFAL